MLLPTKNSNFTKEENEKESKFYFNCKRKYIVEERGFDSEEYYFSYESETFPAKELGDEEKRILIQSSQFPHLYYVFEDKNNTFFYVENKKKFIIKSTIFGNLFLTTDKKEDLYQFLNSNFYKIFERTTTVDEESFLPCYKEVI